LTRRFVTLLIQTSQREDSYDEIVHDLTVHLKEVRLTLLVIGRCFSRAFYCAVDTLYFHASCSSISLCLSIRLSWTSL